METKKFFIVTLMVSNNDYCTEDERNSIVTREIKIFNNKANALKAFDELLSVAYDDYLEDEIEDNSEYNYKKHQYFDNFPASEKYDVLLTIDTAIL